MYGKGGPQFWGILLVLATLLEAAVGAEVLDEAFRKRFPYTIAGVTYEGGPVLTIPYGEWNIGKALENGEKEKLRQLYHEIFDKLAKLSVGSDGKVKPGVSIFDMMKYTLAQGFNPEANAFMVEMTNYFETKYDTRILKRWYLINTPTGFQMAYNLLKLFLPEKTQSKWKVYGVQRVWWQWELFKDVSPGELTQQYGGFRDILSLTSTTEGDGSDEPTTKTEVEKEEAPEDDAAK